MHTPSSTTAATELVDFILDKIPMARAMGLALHRHEEDVLVLSAPLAPNVNDKGCAFGGSLASLMTLTGWTLIELVLKSHDLDCDLYVGNSTIRYLAPVWTDFRAEARLAGDSDWSRFLATLVSRGKARADIECVVPGEDGTPAATLRARFVAKRRSD